MRREHPGALRVEGSVEWEGLPQKRNEQRQSWATSQALGFRKHRTQGSGLCSAFIQHSAGPVCLQVPQLGSGGVEEVCSSSAFTEWGK